MSCVCRICVADRMPRASIRFTPPLPGGSVHLVEDQPIEGPPIRISIRKPFRLNVSLCDRIENVDLTGRTRVTEPKD